ncbi:hypothetical protein DS043_17450 [Escherichia coli]|nr:hypothetical protein [Escherichia coli]EFO2173080.1 hypothetical protein [Escherichia coli]EGO3792049.1 hypothetical protein [Escherichia coli]HAI9815771.1 hypothetical protein [Escherichia coli]
MLDLLIDTLKMNSFDPRGNTEFLLLSHSINKYKLHTGNRTYWLTMQKRCLSLIKKYGYDLQTGAWLCLIETYINGWDGVARSSFLFTRCVVTKDLHCWPPVTFAAMRIQIVEWYCNHVIPAVYDLDKEYADPSCLRLMTESLRHLTEQEIIFNSPKYELIKNLLFFLQSRLETSFINKSRYSNIIRHKDTDDSDRPDDPEKKTLKKTSNVILILLLFAVITILFFLYLNRTVLALSFDKILPGNYISEYIVAHSDCKFEKSVNPDITDTLKKQLFYFEDRVNTTEKTGHYLTLSEIKSLIYKMQLSMMTYPLPVSSRIAAMKKRLLNGEKPDYSEIKEIEEELMNLQCQLLFIRSKK